MHIVLLARHYPPEVSGGARRPFLMAKALRDRGHKVTVVTPFSQPHDPDSLCVPHPVFGKTPRAPLPISTAQAPQNSHKHGLRDLARQWLLWPDPEIRWCRTAAKAIINSGLKPDWLITTSPPESIHLAGHQIAKALPVKWLAEFRDTWVTVPHREVLAKSAIRAMIERKIARYALSKVDAIACVSQVGLDEFQHYISPETPHIMIDHFSAAPTKATPLPPDDFNLVHTGGFSLSDRRRQVQPLLDKIAFVAQRRSDLHLHLAGRLTVEEIDAAGKAQGFKISLHGEVSLENAQALQAGADALLLYTPENSHALPGKYAEYCFARRPILYLGSGDWLSLVENPETIRPLMEALPELQKGERTPATHAPDVRIAAEQLEGFLLENSRQP